MQFANINAAVLGMAAVVILLPSARAELRTITPSSKITGGPYYFRATSGNAECIRYITGMAGDLCLLDDAVAPGACNETVFTQRCDGTNEYYLGAAHSLTGPTGIYRGMKCNGGTQSKETQLTVYEESLNSENTAEIPTGNGLGWSLDTTCTWNIYLKFPPGDSDQTFAPSKSPTTAAPTTSPTTAAPTTSPTTASPTTAPTTQKLQDEYNNMAIGSRPSQLGHGQITWETLCNAVGDGTEGCPTWGKFAWCDASYEFFDAPKADQDCTQAGIMVEDGRCYTCKV